MFGRASSRPVQKLETDPDIAIVPCEALSKGTPEMRKNHLPSLVGGNEQMVGENAIAFSCSEAGNFHLAAGSQTFSGREELLCGVPWSRPGAATPAKSCYPSQKAAPAAPRLFDKGFKPVHAEALPGVAPSKSMKDQ
jgi:hypothetical protein